MRQIEPHRVWVGHAGDGRAFGTLFDRDIRAIVQLALEEPPLTAPRSMIVLRFPLIDGDGNEEPLLRLCASSVARLIGEGIPTLVCCGAGMSRAPAIVAAALSLQTNAAPGDCLESVTRDAPADVSPVLWRDIMDAVRTL